jgi:two-component system sensor histidine kinase/response regulator
VSLGSLFIVDDDTINIEALSALVGAAGYDVAFARDGLEALPLIEVAKPDVVLLDVDMGPLDGFQTCARLKANPRTAEIPIIFLSGVTDAPAKVRAFEVGGADYVDKPFQPSEILARVAHQIRITRLQSEMRIANERLLELDRLKGTFAAMLVHDLRSPLAVVHHTLGFLKTRGVPDDRELEELVGYSAEALDKTLSMIAEVLDIYRTEQTKASRPLVPGDIGGVLDRCAVAARIEALHRKIDLRVSIDRPLPVAHDAQRLERAITNLLTNALKFTPPGGCVTLEARAPARGASEQVHIEVRDTGEGIAENELPRIFDLYQQADSRQRLAGVGLGLAIVKRIIDAHHGEVSVQSQVGVGTVFSIALPAASALEHPA